MVDGGHLVAWCAFLHLHSMMHLVGGAHLFTVLVVAGLCVGIDMLGIDMPALVIGSMAWGCHDKGGESQ
jgi:hypothetical protein